MPYIILIIASVIMLIYLAYTFFIRPSIANKKINSQVENYFNAKGYKIIDNNKLYDKLVIKEDEKIYLKYVLVPANSQITINCKEKWKLSWGGSSAKVGRAYPNHRYLKEVEEFALKEMDGKKVFIIYPTTEHILRYINECELETIDINKTPYGYKLVRFDHFGEEMDTCINN